MEISIAFFAIMLVFALSSAVHAASKESELYEGDTFSVSDGGSISVYDYQLRYTMSSNSSMVYIEDMNSDEFVFVDKENCGDLEYLEICYDRSSGSTIFSRLFSRVPSLALDHEIGQEESLVGEENWFNVTITNDGERIANDTDYALTVPDKIKVTDVEGGVLVDGRILWNETLADGEEHVITVRFKALETFDDLVFFSELAYDNYYLLVEETEETEFSADSFLGISFTTDPEEVYLGNEFTLRFNLTNDHSFSNNDDNGYNLSIRSFSLKKSELPEIISWDGFIIDHGKSLFWSGVFDYNDSKEFTLKMKSSDSGRIEIPLHLEINESRDGRLVEIEPVIILDVVSRDIQIFPQFTPGQELNASTRYELDIVLQNMDMEVAFTGITVKVSNLNGVSERTIERLPRGTKTTVKDLSFLTSSVDSNVREALDITVTYENNFFEEKQASKQIS
ncbi:MAG: hypothetical protein ACOC32_05030, partial [Nanoarchaeota archaeon]